MDTTKLADKDRQLQSDHITIKYYRILLVLVIIAFCISATFAYNDGQQIKQLVKVQSQQTKIIETNQHDNGIAVEGFFRGGLVCTLTQPINPAPTPAYITTILNKCFPNTPLIK